LLLYVLKGRKWKHGKNYSLWSFIMYIFPPDITKVVKNEDELDGARSMHGEKVMHTKFWSENMKEKGHLEDLEADWRIILKWILRTCGLDSTISSAEGLSSSQGRHSVQLVIDEVKVKYLRDGLILVSSWEILINAVHMMYVLLPQYRQSGSRQSTDHRGWVISICASYSKHPWIVPRSEVQPSWLRFSWYFSSPESNSGPVP
jgi:hypothetical protein